MKALLIASLLLAGCGGDVLAATDELTGAIEVQAAPTVPKCMEIWDFDDDDNSFPVQCCKDVITGHWSGGRACDSWNNQTGHLYTFNPYKLAVEISDEGSRYHPGSFDDDELPAVSVEPPQE